MGYLWCFTRIFIPSPSGRKRFNVLGAINTVSKEIITVSNQTYINAESVCQLLIQLAELNLKIPLTLVLDNARYQKCALVRNCVEMLGIELLYLPAYSPHLNLIERFWKFVKKQCLYSKYYETFPEFKQAIEQCLEEANSTRQQKLESLLTWNFQSFKYVNKSLV